MPLLSYLTIIVFYLHAAVAETYSLHFQDTMDNATDGHHGLREKNKDQSMSSL